MEKISATVEADGAYTLSDSALGNGLAHDGGSLDAGLALALCGKLLVVGCRSTESLSLLIIDYLHENFGHQLGKTLCSPLGRGIMGEGIFSKVLSATSCACDARMAGAMIPVMSNSGSGNQGICATMPVVVFAEENHNTDEETIRALIISNLTAIYIKQHLGALSALCGCVVASTGSSCGITYLMGGNYDQMAFAVKNMIANLTGMICDGAKPSCALKLTSGVSTAVLSAMLAIQNKHVTSVEGIIDDDVDQSIRNLTEIGRRGMDETDKFVLNIMTHKTKPQKA